MNQVVEQRPVHPAEIARQRRERERCAVLVEADGEERARLESQWAAEDAQREANGSCNGCDRPGTCSDAEGVTLCDDCAATITRPVAREFRKIATIHASQWHKHGDHPAVKHLPSGHSLRDAAAAAMAGAYGWIETLEGGHIVTPGDWIATGTDGEHWPIKPDKFTKTYERVDT